MDVTESSEWMDQFTRAMSDVRRLLFNRSYYGAAKAFILYIREQKARDAMSPHSFGATPDTPVFELFDVRTAMMLDNAGFRTYLAVSRASDEELRDVRHLGYKTLAIIREAVPYENSNQSRGLSNKSLYENEDKVFESTEQRSERIESIRSEQKSGRSIEQVLRDMDTRRANRIAAARKK